MLLSTYDKMADVKCYIMCIIADQVNYKIGRKTSESFVSCSFLNYVFLVRDFQGRDIMYLQGVHFTLSVNYIVISGSEKGLSEQYSAGYFALGSDRECSGHNLFLTPIY